MFKLKMFVQTYNVFTSEMIRTFQFEMFNLQMFKLKIFNFKMFKFETNIFLNFRMLVSECFDLKCF